VDASKLTDKAKIAAERGQYDYAINLYLNLLEFQPDNVEAREALRAVEVRKFQERGITKSTPAGWFKGFGSFLAAQLHLVLRKYEKAMGACEAFLKNDPYNRSMQCLLARAAERSEYFPTATMVLEDVRRLDGAPTKGLALKAYIRVLRNLGELYAQTEQLPLATERFEEILRLAPGDRDAERRIRDIAAQRSMVEGGWDKAGKQGSYREVLKSEDDAKRLEESHRDIRTREDVEGAIERVKKDVEEDPTNTRYLVQLGDLYRMAKDWNTARAAYQKARELDPSNFLVVERLGDLKLAEMDARIVDLQSDPSAKAQAAELRKERMAFAFQEYQKRVKARPQDLPTRFALGSILLAMGQHKDAAVQFQHAARDPKTRRPGLYRLGVCLMKQGLVEMAIDQFRKAVAGSSLVDQEAKEILYALGEAHESQGSLAEALGAYKRIFDIDMNFKDISSKIEELYKKGVRDAG